MKSQIKDFVVEVMIKPVPKILLKSFAMYEGTVLVCALLVSGILLISKKFGKK